MIFPARININLSLNSQLELIVRNLNEQIVNHGFSEISFQNGSPHVPHITLLMGEVNSEADFKEIVLHCENFGQIQLPFSYQISKPYLKQPSKNFIFIDTNPQFLFKEFRSSLYKTLEGFLKCEFHGGPDNTSHITIGYAKPTYPYFDFLLREFRLVEGRAEQIRISAAGNRGTCVNVLHTIHLGCKTIEAPNN